MGAHAARTLLGWIGSEGNPTSLRVLLPVELIIRGTTSPHEHVGQSASNR
jgi:DNA-binding LacI/PurR family transcriptional regulator